jgi:methylmalonyl-CoA/ethylmalonyl-CoA epimerase
VLFLKRSWKKLFQLLHCYYIKNDKPASNVEINIEAIITYTIIFVYLRGIYITSLKNLYLIFYSDFINETSVLYCRDFFKNQEITHKGFYALRKGGGSMNKKQAQKKIDHIGIAVRSIQDALPFYVDHLHLQLEAIEEVNSEKVKVAFLKTGESRIELLEPLSQQSVIAKFIKKRGEGIHHIALRVDNITERIDDLNRNGIEMIHNQPKQGAHGSQIAFIHPKESNGVLYELCEKKKQ